MGLRLADGIDPLLFEHRTGVALDRLIAGDARARLAAHGLIDGGQTRLKATPAGMRVLNALIAELVSDREITRSWPRRATPPATRPPPPASVKTRGTSPTPPDSGPAAPRRQHTHD